MIKNVILLLMGSMVIHAQSSEQRGNNQLIAGQQAVTGTAAALPSNATKTICVKALDGNAIKVYLGPSTVTTSNGMELGAGESWCGALTNTNLIFVVASTTGASVSFMGTN